MEQTGANKTLKGLDGWLILLGIGILHSQFRNIIEFDEICKDFFAGNKWKVLTDTNSEIYHPLLAPLYIGEMFVNIAIFITGFYLIYLFFTEKKLFPKLYIFISVFVFVFDLAEAFLVKIIMPTISIDYSEIAIKLAMLRGISLIWVLYMLVSKRVKATFIR